MKLPNLSDVNKFSLARGCAVSLLALTLSLLLPVTGSAHETGDDHFPEFQEGVHYHEIHPAVDTDVPPGNMEVLEIFWYGCPHCYEFEKHLKNWQQDKPANVTFVRMPAALNRNWTTHARAYYALEKMDMLDEIHPLFFAAIHVQGRRLRDVESMQRFLSQHGVDADEFKQAYGSSYVEEQIKRSDQLVRRYGVNSVPTVIVHGKYRATASDAGGHERLIQMINWLAQRETNTMDTMKGGAN